MQTPAVIELTGVQLATIAANRAEAIKRASRKNETMEDKDLSFEEAMDRRDENKRTNPDASEESCRKNGREMKHQLAHWAKMIALKLQHPAAKLAKRTNRKLRPRPAWTEKLGRRLKATKAVPRVALTRFTR